MRISFATAIAAVLSLALAPLALAQEPTTPPGPDAFFSNNVEYLGSIKPDIGLTTGTKIIGNRMFVTSGKNISIYDISKPASPVRIGFIPNVSWENEEVPTNGKILAVASDFYSVMPNCVQNDPGTTGRFTGCVQFFDVRDPAHIREIGATPTQNHTAECVLDCTWFYGKAGTIIDARHALDDPASPTFEAPHEAGNWVTYLRDHEGVNEKSCHHIRELRPGVLLTACRPFTVITVNPKDAPGASPLTPQVLYAGEAAKFVHSARWPRQGDDKFALVGGEENFNPQCEAYPSKENRVIGNNSEFSVYEANVNDDPSETAYDFQLKDQIVPAGNGTYTDGKPPANHLGCSVHWFQEHPTFKNGGLVALSEYEDGVRFLQIKKDGSIEEQGYFVSLGSSSSSPKWAGKDDVLYSIDYDRGIDILKWKGEHYVPKPGKGKGLKPEKGKVRGTNGTTPVPALNARQRASLTRLGTQLRAGGWSPGLCRLAASL